MAVSVLTRCPAPGLSPWFSTTEDFRGPRNCSKGREILFLYCTQKTKYTANTCMHAYIYVHTYMRASTHTHIHTYVRMYQLCFSHEPRISCLLMMELTEPWFPRVSSTGGILTRDASQKSLAHCLAHGQHLINISCCYRDS